MAGLSVWNGSAFVDGDPKIWNGSAFVAPSECHIWNGSAFVKVWPTFARQRMVKSGTWSSSYMSGTMQVTGWASDGTYPAAVSGNSLVVSGSGSVTVSWSFTGSGGGSSNWKIRHNSSGIGSNRSGTVSRTVADGDTISFWYTNAGALNYTITGGYVEIIPS